MSEYAGEPIRHQSSRLVPVVGPKEDDAEKDTVYLYHGQEDDRPLLWRTTLNDLTGAMGDLLSKRRKKLGKSLLLAESVDESPTNGDDEQVNSVAELKARRAAKRGGGGDGPGEDVPGEEPEGGESAERKEARLRARAEYLAKERELQGVKGDIATDDVLMRLRKQQAGELASSVLECEEGSEQAHTWMKALEDVSSKRQMKLEENDSKNAQAKAAAAEAEEALEQLEAELMAGKVAHNGDQATLRNTTKVEQKTADVWAELNESMRVSHKEVMVEAADRQRAQMRLSKHLQDLTIGEQEVAKRLAIQVRAGEEMGVEGVKLKKLWRRSYLEEDMLVAGASAEVEAEERARAHLIGHGDRIRGKFEQASGNLTAQKAIVAEQSEMDDALKEKSEAAQKRISVNPQP
jgi:hypothetical protein